MADLAIITPTRGRPAQLAAMLAAVHDTAVTDFQVYVGIDDDDPDVTSGAYADHLLGKPWPNVVVYTRPRTSLSGWTNHLAAQALAGGRPPRYLASLGDDHLPRTKGWDKELIGAIDALGGPPGFAYGNDLFQGAGLPTAWVVSAEIVRALGWMMLPACRHMYVDNAILALGQATGRIVYRPGVVVEHMHPVPGKAGWDDTYLASNNDAVHAADRAAFEAWRDRGGLARDVSTVASLVR